MSLQPPALQDALSRLSTPAGYFKTLYDHMTWKAEQQAMNNLSSRQKPQSQEFILPSNGVSISTEYTPCSC